MKESNIEKHLVDKIKNKGGIAYKFVSPNCIGVPDRLILLPIPVELQPTISKYVYFAECKAPGKRARASQLREHAHIQALGYKVIIINNKENTP